MTRGGRWRDTWGMTPAVTDESSVAEALRTAFETRDLEAFGALLADDVRWGDDDLPQRCRSRADVLGVFSRALADGADADFVEVRPGRGAVLCEIVVRWPLAEERPETRRIFQVFRLKGGRVAEILSGDDPKWAEEAAGLSA